jgi:hypothetical protein
MLQSKTTQGTKALRDKHLILLLLGANNNEPIPSLEHLKAELFLVKRALGKEN